MRAGNQIVHAIPDTVEPWVNAQLRFLYEDDLILVLDKPAPLPMHPCGRFNKHSLVPMLRAAFADLEPRPVHRLDADTTGVVVLAKDKSAARRLGEQFEARTTDKRYLARVEGRVEADEHELHGHVAKAPSASGKRELSADARTGRGAHTQLWVRERDPDSTLVELRPHSGRTNQLRVQLADLGHPIRGDSAYGKGAMPLDDREAMSGRSELCLHAWRLTLRHPGDGRELVFEAVPPQWGKATGIG
jgi:RluA family pseudouridine synthase